MPSPQHSAFLLDFDGTLVDIAPTPEAVIVPEGLKENLAAVREKCGDALAVITGRSIEQIDHFLPGIPFAVAGEHGIAIRRRPGGPIERASLPEVPEAWLAEAHKLAEGVEGVRIELKPAGFVLHYRGAPDAAKLLKDAADRWVATKPAFHVQAAKMAWEIRPDGIDKGHAVTELMKQAHFVGRKPVFVGDDVTDEHGIRAARALGGFGLRLPDDFSDPAAVRAWLASLAGGKAGAWGG